MIPEELYKRRRRHDNTPASMVLIITNYIVTTILFTSINATSWFFYVVLAGLAVYNYFTIRRNLEEYTRVNIIAYIVGWAGIVLLFFLTRKM
ncbi:hypothetical protein [Mucilaginibacter auburnensis]|uniref:Uncharacterized protein n=1 Tax=Mucilaginibacter auburnensis TaxID=1457233 RepID=A0A2H9VPZ0_9SPHI|nr:hypothetical protein [Mucilaginibacter auburnensis]PJJ80404.1 hypothetical protein CLV57_3555 [Mucilaginibacter auburnensis]